MACVHGQGGAGDGRVARNRAGDPLRLAEAGAVVAVHYGNSAPAVATR